MSEISSKYIRKAEDECSGKTETMDYVKCRATKMEKEQGTPAEKAFPTAWSIACKYKRDQLTDADEHCQRKPSGYFKGKKSSEIEMGKKAHLTKKQENILKRLRNPAFAYEDLTPRVQETLIKELEKEVDKFLSEKYFGRSLMATSDVAAELELLAGHTPESFEKMMDDNPELKEKWDEMTEKHKDVVKNQHKSAGCENLPNEKMQQMCEDKKDSKEEEKEDKKAHDKTARTLTANWGLTAEEAYELLAEEELEAYLAELEAEMEATKDENAANSGFIKYEQYKEDAHLPNTWHGGQGGRKGNPPAGGGKGRNYLYHDYGSAPKGKAYNEWYFNKKKLNNPENRKNEEAVRSKCPGYGKNTGKAVPCAEKPKDKTKSE